MTVLFFFATNEVEVARKKPSGAPFISVDGSVPGAEVTWDHHVTGEKINLDAMPSQVPGGYSAFATCLPDIDAAASMVVATLGGECNVLAETAAILRCASHWCDYLSPNPDFDAEQNRLGRGLLDWFNGHRPRLKFGEVDPKDGAWFGEATQALLEAVISFESGSTPLPYVDDYPKACERAREFYSEGGISFHGIGKCRLALVEPPPGPAKARAFGPDAVCSLLPPDVGVVVYADGGAAPNVYKYTVGVNPLSNVAPSSLKPALELLAAREFELAQAEKRAAPLGGAPIPANKNWGGRPTVFGSPWDGSHLTIGTVVTIVRRALDILHPSRLAWPTRRVQ